MLGSQPSAQDFVEVCEFDHIASEEEGYWCQRSWSVGLMIRKRYLLENDKNGPSVLMFDLRWIVDKRWGVQNRAKRKQNWDWHSIFTPMGPLVKFSDHWFDKALNEMRQTKRFQSFVRLFVCLPANLFAYLFVHCLSFLSPLSLSRFLSLSTQHISLICQFVAADSIDAFFFLLIYLLSAYLPTYLLFILVLSVETWTHPPIDLSICHILVQWSVDSYWMYYMMYLG